MEVKAEGAAAGRDQGFGGAGRLVKEQGADGTVVGTQLERCAGRHSAPGVRIKAHDFDGLVVRARGQQCAAGVPAAAVDGAPVVVAVLHANGGRDLAVGIVQRADAQGLRVGTHAQKTSAWVERHRPDRLHKRKGKKRWKKKV